MTDAKAVETKEKTVAVINQGGCTYTTSVGPLGPKCGVVVPEAEAARLIKYTDIVRADSIVKGDDGRAALLQENAALKVQVADLSAKVAEFLGAQSKKELDALKEKHAPASGDPSLES